MELNLKLYPRTVYRVQIVIDSNTLEIGEFEKTSEWEGMIKLQRMKDQREEVIIASSKCGTLAELLRNVFSLAQPIECDVVKASPPLWTLCKRRKEEL